LLLVLAIALRRKAIAAHHRRVEFVSWYWHFVDAVWVVVFLTVYVLGR
jgi:cytochrome c oxidase subunit 3/cytochrome o ubiquinol oxidase subunit 3